MGRKQVLTKSIVVLPWLIVVAGVLQKLQRKDPAHSAALDTVEQEQVIEPLEAPGTSIAQVAVEVWRLGRRIDQRDENPRIKDSYDRLVRALDDAKIRIEDPIHQPFIEGSRADVLDAPSNVDFEREQLFVSEVLRPAVYIQDVCLVQPQIILDRRPSNKEELE